MAPAFRPLLPTVLLAWHLLAATGPAHAADPPSPAPPSTATETARDVLKRAMGPVVNVLSREPVGSDRAFALRLRLGDATNQAQELKGRRVEILCQPPDRLLWQMPALGTIVTISRRGQDFWAHPATKLAPILARVDQQTVSKEDQKPLAPLRLPIPARVFWAGVNLVRVRDGGAGVPGDNAGAGVCRRVEVTPPFAKERGSLVRVWLRETDAVPTQLDFVSPREHATVAFESARLLPGLPESSFDPKPEQAADLLPIPYAKLRPFMKLLEEENDRQRKKG